MHLNNLFIGIYYSLPPQWKDWCHRRQEKVHGVDDLLCSHLCVQGYGWICAWYCTPPHDLSFSAVLRVYHKIFDWHIGWTLYRLGFTSIISLENYGWFIECMFSVPILISTPSNLFNL